MGQLAVRKDEGKQSRKMMEKGKLEQSSEAAQSSSVHKLRSHVKDTEDSARGTGLQKVLSLLESEDVDIRHRAVEVVASLAAKDENKEKIVEAGGLKSLLKLLESCEAEDTRRLAASAVASLAMIEANQELIMAQGAIGLLARTADDAEDPQTLRVLAAAISNLCKNDKLQYQLGEQGGIRALLGMVRSRHPDVLAEVARGFANFAECESRCEAQGSKFGRSLLIDVGALPWIVANANNYASPIRRQIENALCHLAQLEENAEDLVAGGALWELVRIYLECPCEHIRSLAHRSLRTSNTFQKELIRRETNVIHVAQNVAGQGSE